MRISSPIIIGLILFLALITFPIYFALATGRYAYKPKPEIPPEKRCVEPAEYMRAYHMDLLAKWKGMAVREGKRTYLSTEGREYRISFIGTCMDCHKEEARFCAQCHNYLGVSPPCWGCHPLPG